MLPLLFACSGSSSVIGLSDGGATDDTGVPDISGDDTGETDDGCGPVEADDAGYSDLFDTTRVHTIELSVTDADASALAADPGSWVPADLTIDGHAYPGVGVRWRGPADQERWDGKPGFRIDFRQEGTCDTYAGLSHISLDAMTGDAVQGRLLVASALFAGAGLPVSQASFTTVSVNGESFGLYADVEVVDGAFVARRWGDESVLWEGGDDADFTARGIGDWHDVDSSGSDATLAAVATIVQGSDPDFYTAADAVLDMDQLLTTWGMLAAIGHGGSYPYQTGDVYLRADPADGRLSFVTWNLDDGWNPEFGWNYVETGLGLRCVYDEACAAALKTHIDAALDTTAALDPVAIARTLLTVSDDAVDADTRRGTTASSVRTSRSDLSHTMATWPDTIRAQME